MFMSFLSNEKGKFSRSEGKRAKTLLTAKVAKDTKEITLKSCFYCFQVVAVMGQSANGAEPGMPK
jgi:hypothetical protein